jgi:CheY-like chemotaxis protein
VIVAANARRRLKSFRQAGYEAYLVRPVRPRSLLGQLHEARERREPAVFPPAIECAPPESAPSQPLNLRILLAEDNSINALLARSVLEKVGCTTIEVSDGSEAVEAVRATIDGREPAFDLILMDVHMPVLDGLEAAQAIRRMIGETTRGRGPVPPIIALTANAFAEDRKRCLAAGMDDYLAKPFERSELEALLRRWCGDPGKRLGYGAIDESAA